MLIHNLTKVTEIVKRQIYCFEGKTMTGMDGKIALG